MQNITSFTIKMENEKSSSDILKILETLPHRFPFLMIDRITGVHKDINNPIGSWISGIKNVTINEPIFQGHFPGYPVFPGVLTIEAMAQLGAMLVYQFAPGVRDEFVAYLTGADRVRFRAPITPGDTIQLKITVTKERNKLLWGCHGEARVENQLVCEADLMAALISKKQERK